METLVKRHYFWLVLATLISSGLCGQVQTFDLTNGLYQYVSSYPSSDLHFYMFDDGYHSFEQSPKHHFHSNNVPANPIMYHSNPYDQNDPFGLVIGGGINGHPAPGITPQTMVNKVQIKRSWNLVEESQNYFILMFQNIESDTPIDGCVEFHFSKEDIDITSSDILDDYNNWVGIENFNISEYSSFGYTHKYKWEFSGLERDEQRFIYIPANCMQPALSTVLTCAVMKVNTANEDYCPLIYEYEQGDSEEEPVFIYKSVVSNYPHDPNCIIAECALNNDMTQLGDTDLQVKYRIYFQNDGDDVAVNVELKGHFELPPGLTIKHSSLEDASHHAYLNGVYSTSNKYFIKFPNIYLPSTNMDPPPNTYEETIGYADLLVCFDVLDFDILGTKCIHNLVDIHFDSMPPVPVSHSYCREDLDACTLNDKEFACKIKDTDGIKGKVAQPTSSEDYTFNIFPNPTVGEININFPKSIDTQSSLNIFNAQGQLIISKNYLSGVKRDKIDITNLNEGLYFATLRQNNTRKTISFVKL